MPPIMTTITICTTCRVDKANDDPVRDGTRLLNRLDKEIRSRGLDHAISVRGIQCMSACAQACAAQVSGADRFTYVLADLDPQTAAEHLIEMALTHAETDKGLVVKSKRPEAIKEAVIARVPPDGFNDFPLTDDWTRTEDD